MSIYKQVLGEKFDQLHPMLKRRYACIDAKGFVGKGHMHQIDGGPKWLFPLFWLGAKWKLLFPERGHNIPFTIRNTVRIGSAGQAQVHWERIFHFEKKKRYFNALMSLDAERNVIQDYLGEPPLMYSDLSFSVTGSGDLHIVSKKQRLVLGQIEIPLPAWFQGLAEVTEKYDDERKVYLIHVTVKNPLLGKLFSYEGEFTSDDIS